MLSEKLVNKSELLNWIKKEVTSYCDRNNLPVLPVKYGHVPTGSKAVFAFPPARIQVWEKYSNWLTKHIPYNRVWHVHHSVTHELWHYRQYLYSLRQNKPITIEAFDEKETYNQGDTQADKIVGLMSSNEINPLGLSTILPQIGSGILSGIGIGTGWTMVDHVYKKMTKRANPGTPVTPEVTAKGIIELSRTRTATNEELSSLRRTLRKLEKEHASEFTIETQREGIKEAEAKLRSIDKQIRETRNLSRRK